MIVNDDEIHLIINPASGARSTETILEEEVLPLLKQNGTYKKISEHRTACEGDGVRIGKELSRDVKPSDTLTLVLLGGDGTTHEVLNGIVKTEKGKSTVPVHIRIALVPTGTANALYASLYPGLQIDEKAGRMKSLEALLSSRATEYPLALTSVTSTNTTIAHLITSHALHASILADSEALRSTHPGIERFKIAAAQNMSKWTNAIVELTGKTVQRYDSQSSTFKEEPTTQESLSFKGPILYFVCVTTDRLEPAFVPAPFSGPSSASKYSASLQRPSDAVDVVIVRPLRDPSLSKYLEKPISFWVDDESQSIREEYAAKHAQNIFGGMYNEGQHVNLHYDGEEGLNICEYFRCAGYKWKPLESKAKRTCVDGSVFEADEIQVRVLGREEGAGKVVVCK